MKFAVTWEVNKLHLWLFERGYREGKTDSTGCKFLENDSPSSFVQLELLFFKHTGERCKYRTGNDHHADGKNLLVIGLGGDVTKAHRGHASHREVQRGDVHGSPGRSRDQFRRGAGIGPQIAVRWLGDVRQLPQPRVLDSIVRVRPSYRVPLTQQPFLLLSSHLSLYHFTFSTL